MPRPRTPPAATRPRSDSKSPQCGHATPQSFPGQPGRSGGADPDRVREDVADVMADGIAHTSPRVPTIDSGHQARLATRRLGVASIGPRQPVCGSRSAASGAVGWCRISGRVGDAAGALPAWWWPEHVLAEAGERDGSDKQEQSSPSAFEHEGSAKAREREQSANDCGDPARLTSIDPWAGWPEDTFDDPL